MDDLTRINGIGPAMAKKLAAAGITTFEQLALDTVAGQHGVKAAWIAEASTFISGGNPASAGEPNPAAAADAAGIPSDAGEAAPDADALPAEGPAGTNQGGGTPPLHGAVRISAKREGFRRAGMAHGREPVEHPAGTFSEAQLEQLLAEPMLVVELV